MFANLVVELKKHHYSQRGLAAYIGISESSMNDKMNYQSYRHLSFWAWEARPVATLYNSLPDVILSESPGSMWQSP